MTHERQVPPQATRPQTETCVSKIDSDIFFLNLSTTKAAKPSPGAGQCRSLVRRDALTLQLLSHTRRPSPGITKIIRTSSLNDTQSPALSHSLPPSPTSHSHAREADESSPGDLIVIHAVSERAGYDTTLRRDLGRGRDVSKTDQLGRLATRHKYCTYPTGRRR